MGAAVGVALEEVDEALGFTAAIVGAFENPIKRCEIEPVNLAVNGVGTIVVLNLQ